MLKRQITMENREVYGEMRMADRKAGRKQVGSEDRDKG